MTELVRWIMRCWNMIDVVRVGIKTCPPKSCTMTMAAIEDVYVLAGEIPAMQKIEALLCGGTA